MIEALGTNLWRVRSPYEHINLNPETANPSDLIHRKTGDLDYRPVFFAGSPPREVR